MVGERGPELFAPGMNGTIIPNGAGGGMTLVFNNYAPINSERQLEEMIVAAGARISSRGGLG
jgi:hypothetical protein